MITSKQVIMLLIDAVICIVRYICRVNYRGHQIIRHCMRTTAHRNMYSIERVTRYIHFVLHSCRLYALTQDNFFDNCSDKDDFILIPLWRARDRVIPRLKSDDKNTYVE